MTNQNLRLTIFGKLHTDIYVPDIRMQVLNFEILTQLHYLH